MKSKVASNINGGVRQTSRAVLMVQGQPVESGNTSNWRGLIATFISAQDVRESSRKLYTRTLSRFFVWLNDEGLRIDELTRKDILEYKDSLLQQNLSGLTIASYLTAVRKFYEWAEAEKLYPNISRGIKTPRKQQLFKKQHLPEGKCRELLAYFQGQSLRNYALVSLLLRTGLRTIEVTRANISDIRFYGERRVLNIQGKGHDEKDDFVVLSEKAYAPIERYLLMERKGAKLREPLFTSNSHQNFGGRLTTKTISSICKEGLRAIGLEGREFTAHSLRHTTAVAILRHGGQLTDVQSVLRHASPVTSQIYTESIRKELRLQNAPELTLDEVF